MANDIPVEPGSFGRCFASGENRMEGTELRSRRIRIGCSRGHVAHALGVSDQTLQAWEDDGITIACPSAVEQVLRKFEAQRDHEETLPSYTN